MSESQKRLVFQIFTPFALGYLIASIFRSINSVIGTDIAAELGASATDLGVLTSAFFAAAIFAQLPAGLALDRFGPKRVGATLLCIAALGGLLFAVAPNVPTLIAGRALIGIGVTTGMAVAFKAFSHYFSSDRLPFLNGLGLAAGGIGMMTGTWPVEMALGLTDWRGVVLTVSALTALTGVAILVMVPKGEVKSNGDSFKKQIDGLMAVLSSRAYWRFAPLLMISSGTYAGIHTLWSGPWLRDVAGFDRGETASTLFLVAATTVIALPLGGYIATRLNRLGISTMSFVIPCIVAFVATLCVISLQGLALTKTVWMAFGFFGPMSLTAYAAINKSFPKKLTGRVNACLTILWMAGAFLVQTGIGAVLDTFPRSTDGGYAAEGYQYAITILIGLHLAALVWYWAAGVLWREDKAPVDNAQGTVPA